MEDLAAFRSSRWPSIKWSVTVTIVVIVAFAGAVLLDRWYARSLLSGERERVSAYALPYAGALESETQKRISELNGLKALVETQKSIGDVLAVFPGYAEVLSAGISGVSELQLIRDGKVMASWSPDSTQTVAGYDLFSDSRASVASDIRRALASDSVVVTGPILLFQGDSGIMAHRRVFTDDPGFPQLVAIAARLSSILLDAGRLAPTPESIAFSLKDRNGAIVNGSRSIVDPVTILVNFPGGDWTLDAAPAAGWQPVVSDGLRPLRLALVIALILLLWFLYTLVGRQRRLAMAVLARTTDLAMVNAKLQQEAWDRESVEHQLRENDEKLQLALNNARMSTWEYDLSTSSMHYSRNSAAMLGLPEGAVDEHGQGKMEDLPDEFRDCVKSAVAEAIQSSSDSPTGECSVEFAILSPEGGARWLYVRGEVQDNVRRGELRLLGVVVDITERKKLEEQLLQAQKMEAVGTLAGGIAHDFNNLLTAIVGFAELSQSHVDALKSMVPASAAQRRVEELGSDLDEIIKAGERASLLTGQLLAFSRRQVYRPTQVDVNSVVREVERMLKLLIGERVVLETKTSSDPLTVLADPGQMSQVIVNLVVNARDALPSGGRITVETNEIQITGHGEAPFAGVKAGKFVMISVEDNGVGMSAEVQTRVFEPFFTTKRVGEGTGLGLSMVYGIATQSGGHVVVESEVGVGTVMRVLLPFHDVPGAPEPEAHALTPSDRQPTVLVVEDEQGLRRLVAEVLTRAGFSVRVAGDGFDALAILSAADVLPDLVLSDVVMPRLGGRALAEEMDKLGFNIPVLFMSGYPAGAELPDNHGYSFIGKPFTPDAIVERVRSIIERS